MALQWEPEWQRLYVEALLETDQGNLLGGLRPQKR